jgi:hypothetical protein
MYALKSTGMPRFFFFFTKATESKAKSRKEQIKFKIKHQP